MKRHKMSLSKSRKHFTRNAVSPHPLNMMMTGPGGPMRGGIRL